MSKQGSSHTKAAAAHLTAVPSGILQLKCACGNRSAAGGECESCGKGSLQRKASGQTSMGAGLSVSRASVMPAKLVIGASDDLRVPGLRPDMDSSADRDFSSVRVRSGGASQSGHPLPYLDSIQRSFGHHDVSQVRAHTGSGAAAEARSMGAEAFARGADVTFARPPSLHTAAHEAAHVIQQRAGVDISGGMGRQGDRYERHADEVADRVARGQSSELLLDAHPGAGVSRPAAVQGTDPAHPVAASAAPVVQLRRIPPNVRSLLTSGTGKGANFDANAEGALRLIDHAMEELTPAERAKVKTARLAGLTEAQFNALPRLERRSRWADAIIAQFPDLQLSDPGDASLTDAGPRPAPSPDAANLTKVVGNADKLFNDVASGARDAWLKDVFGAGSVATAKAKYAKGRTAMNSLHATAGIVTDRSGYSEEVALGGLTDPPGTSGQKIRVAKSVIDTPDQNDSVTTLLHESMHAGNADVHDQYTGFQTETEANKLTFSSCFEVVPWRILDPTNSNAFAVVPATVPPTFQTFIPAGTSVGGVAAAALTKAEEGAKAATELFREAWTIGLDLHPFYLDVFRTPANWTVAQPQFGGNRFDKSLPFWSKVQKLTIHMKTTIDLASPDEAKHPVSKIDIALSEGLIRRLGFGMDVLPKQKQADILAFEAANSTVAERSTAFPGGAHTSADVERDFLLKLTVRQPTVGPITGNPTRDVRVVRALGTLNWSDVLKPRNPASFAD